MDFNLTIGAFAQDKNFKSFDKDNVYDVIVIGGGPAGLTAAVYCMRKGISTGLIVKEIGGQVAETAGIENYMGYRYINGIELSDKFREQVLQFSIAFEEGSAVSEIIDGPVKKIVMEDGRVFQAKSIIITTGMSWRKLGVPGEKEYTGKGVAYCATCDAPFYAGKKVVVVGGGNSGIEAAIDLAKVATEVTLVQFLDKLTGDKILVDKLLAYPSVSVMYEHEVTAIYGEENVSSIQIKDRKTDESSSIDAHGIFIEIGLIPNSGFIKDLVEVNEFGEIVVDNACKTSIKGIFAAGDVTTVPYKQIIISAGEGAKAALSACEYVLKL